MAVYHLTLRPYGDAAPAAADAMLVAFASPWWLASHLAGATSLALTAWALARIPTYPDRRLARLSRVGTSA